MLTSHPLKKRHRDGFYPQPSYTHPLATAVLTVTSGLMVVVLILGALFVFLAGGNSLPL